MHGIVYQGNKTGVFLLPYQPLVGVTPTTLWCHTKTPLVSHQRAGDKIVGKREKRQGGQNLFFYTPLFIDVSERSLKNNK